LADDRAMAAPVAMWTTTLVPGATVTLRPVWVGTLTPAFPLVQLVPPTTEGVPFWEILVMVTAWLLGFLRVRVRSALTPGWSWEVGVPVAASTVTAVACPTCTDPVPAPVEVKKA
jgi:hypothetical protein